MSAYEYFVQQQQRQSQGSQAQPAGQVPGSFGHLEHAAERPPLPPPPPPPQGMGLVNPLLPMGSLPHGHPLLHQHHRPGIGGLTMGHPNMHPNMNQMLMQPPSGEHPLSQELLQSFLAQQAAHGVALHQAAAAAAAAGLPLPSLQSLHQVQQQQLQEEHQQQPGMHGNLSLLPGSSASDPKGDLKQSAGAEKKKTAKGESTSPIAGSDSAQPVESVPDSSSSSIDASADKTQSGAASIKAEATTNAVTSPLEGTASQTPSLPAAATAATAEVRGNSAAAVEERAARKRKVEANARQAGGLSKFEGVVWHRKKRKWRAQLTTTPPSTSGSSSATSSSSGGNGGGDGDSSESLTVLGWFETAEDAARAYDAHATTLGLPVNFPEPGQEQVVKRVTARYKGVNWNSGNQKWKAQIKVDGKVRHLGYFENEDVAARKYDEMAAAQGKPVNFPAPNSGQQQASKGGAEGGSRGGSSIYKGVCWDKVNSHWKATIKINGKAVNLGNFESEEEAARKFDERANELGRGLNFPPGSAPLTQEDLEASKARALAAAAAAAQQQQAKAQEHDAAAAQAALRSASQAAAKRPHEAAAASSSSDLSTGASGRNPPGGVGRDTGTEAASGGNAAAGTAAEAGAAAGEDEESDDENEGEDEDGAKKQLRTSPGPKTSQFKGVCWHKPSQKWAAQIMVGRKRQHLGSYDTELEAAIKYDEHARASGRLLNFPTTATTTQEEGRGQERRRGSDALGAPNVEVASAPAPPPPLGPPPIEHQLLHRQQDEGSNALSSSSPVEISAAAAAVPTAPEAHSRHVNTAQILPVENLNARPDNSTDSFTSASSTATTTTRAAVDGPPQSTDTTVACTAGNEESSHARSPSNNARSIAPVSDPNSTSTPHPEPQLQPQQPPQPQHGEQTQLPPNENATSDEASAASDKNVLAPI